MITKYILRIEHKKKLEESVIKNILNSLSVAVPIGKGKDVYEVFKHTGGVNKKGEPYYVYYDLDAHNYRCATKSWKVRSA